MAAFSISFIVGMAVVYSWMALVLILGIILMWRHGRRRIQAEQPPPPAVNMGVTASA
jgi:hypothetical protein